MRSLCRDLSDLIVLLVLALDFKEIILKKKKATNNKRSSLIITFVFC